MPKKIWAILAFLLGLFAAIFMTLQGPGYKMGWWDVGFVFFKALPAVVYTGLAAAVLGLIALIVRWRTGAGSALLAVLGIVLALGAASVPVAIRSKAESLPLIHDITTDTNNPPVFVDAVAVRADAPNPPDYAGAEIAAQQRDAYPDIQTIRVREAADTVFEAAQAVVEELGWELIAASAADGRIEATEVTPWFGFSDDVVIRIAPGSAVTLVDVRSKSRVGLSDLGVNADRIRRFRDALLKRLT